MMENESFLNRHVNSCGGFNENVPRRLIYLILLIPSLVKLFWERLGDMYGLVTGDVSLKVDLEVLKTHAKSSFSFCLQLEDVT